MCSWCWWNLTATCSSDLPSQHVTYELGPRPSSIYTVSTQYLHNIYSIYTYLCPAEQMWPQQTVQHQAQSVGFVLCSLGLLQLAGCQSEQNI